MPHRDLLLSPDHAVYLDGVLIQIQALINGATIRREAAAGRVRYLHVELDRHAVVLAEGLPAESYLDTGNRGAFANGGAVCQLHSDFTGAQLWDGQACASLLLDGETVDDWHLRLARRATSLGHTLTDDPDVQVLSDGAMLPPTLQGPGYLTVIVPPGVTSVVLHSRSAVPAEIDRSSDRRRLGIALAAISLDGRALDGAGAAPGLHEVERDGPRSWRWTDGAATLRLPNCDHARELALSWHAGWQAYRIAATGAAPLEPVWHQKIG